ncbi:MAG: helix-turn-helix transcriptional regulator [Prolixibacteraceae bacterium]|nr:helix-turn-helix transcriptional regulator [Prolixibacteraceae bacterium]
MENKLQDTTKNYLYTINSDRGKPFTIIISVITICIIFIDYVALDMNLSQNKLLLYSHILVTFMGFATFLFLILLKTKRISNIVLYSYLYLLTLIETAVSGGLDTAANRGPSVFIATIFTISFVFFYPPLQSLLWLLPNYILFLTLVIVTHETTNQLLSSLGNGSVFFIIILIMKLYVYRQKKREIENQNFLLKFITTKKRKKEEIKPEPVKNINSEVLTKFREYVIEQKNYLDKDLTIGKVAAEIDSNPNYISQCINGHFGKNFNSLINEFRVDEALRIMDHKLSRIITMEAIASQAGFNSKSSFYIAFKNKTGKTPAEYFRKNQ